MFHVLPWLFHGRSPLGVPHSDAFIIILMSALLRDLHFSLVAFMDDNSLGRKDKNGYLTDTRWRPVIKYCSQLGKQRSVTGTLRE